MKHSGRNNLTEGPVLQKLLMFALPTIAGNLCMQLYNVVDSIIVGNYVGTDALAAVGASFPFMTLFNALFMGVSMGAQIVISQSFGAKNYDQLRTVINTGISLAIIIGTCITLIGTPLAGTLLKLLNTPANIFPAARSYLIIIFLGTLGNVFFNLGGGALRGMGDSRWPLLALLVSSLTNIVLDLLFVVKFDMGVAGVAWATTIAHFLSGLVLLWRLQNGGYPAKVHWGDLPHPNKEATKHIFALGLPSAIQNCAMSLGAVIMQSFSNAFGSDFIAANTVVMKADGFAMMPMMGLGMSCTSFVGQNIGAGKKDRAKQGIRAAALCVIVVAVVMGITLYFTGGYIMQAFGASGKVLMMGVNGIHFLAFCYMFMGLDHVLGGSMRGAGVAIAPACTAIAANMCRIPLAYVLGVRPLKATIAKLLESMPAELTALANEYMASGHYASLVEATNAAAANLASLEHHMGMFITFGISMFLGAAMIFCYYKFGKWQDKAVARKINQK